MHEKNSLRSHLQTAADKEGAWGGGAGTEKVGDVEHSEARAHQRPSMPK